MTMRGFTCMMDSCIKFGSTELWRAAFLIQDPSERGFELAACQASERGTLMSLFQH